MVGGGGGGGGVRTKFSVQLWSQAEQKFGFKCDFLQSFSVNSLSSLYLVIIPSLLICNKLSNEWSAVFMGQLVLSEL